jgi:hypothetical protein
LSAQRYRVEPLAGLRASASMSKNARGALFLDDQVARFVETATRAISEPS